MGRWISADYIKAIMKGDRLMQGNCEYELWKQEVDKKVDAMPSIEVMDVITAYQQGWCDALDASINALNDAKSQLGNADQHVQRVEYVENDEKSRCWTCKHFERMHETPIASDGNYYTYVVCTAKECHYEQQTEPQYDAEEVAKDINRRVEMVKKEWNARHVEDEPQTDCPWK